MLIYEQTLSLLNWPFGAAAAWVLLLLVLTLIWAQGFPPAPPTRRGSPEHREEARRAPASRSDDALIYLYLLAPILIVIPVSFSAAAFVVFPPRGFLLRWYVNFLQSRELTEAFGLSLRLAVAVTVTATIAGTLAALALVRYRLPGRELIRTCLWRPSCCRASSWASRC